jgi:molybdate transport system regulatory protein
MGVIYRKAGIWFDMPKQLFGFPLVSKSRGGSEGGKSELTPDGKLLVNAYIQLRDEFDESVKRVVQKFFQTINK